LEDFETTSLEDWEHEFLREYLGHSASGEHVNATEHLADFSRWKLRGGPKIISYAAQYLLRYRVLDIFMDTIVGYRHPDLSTVPRSHLPPLTKRMNRVHDSLSDWTRGVSKFLSLLDTHDTHTQETSHLGGMNLLPWNTPQNMQSKAGMSVSGVLDSPSIA